MSKKRKTISIIVFAAVFVLIILGLILSAVLQPTKGHEAEIQAVMRDAVLHDMNKISFLGFEVNPGFVSAVIVSGILIIFAIVVRIFFIPKFKNVPGKFQLLLEQAVMLFSNMAKGNSPHCNGFISAYIFVAGGYICIGTLFELFGIQVITTTGSSVALPAPLSDINGAICMGCLTYLIIMVAGVIKNGVKGFFKALKEFSLPVSMSFRLFGALLSGALVTELVYHFTSLRYVVPVIVGVLFTLMHALIQTYVLTTLASTYFGEVTEPSHNKKKKNIQNISQEVL